MTIIKNSNNNFKTQFYPSSHLPLHESRQFCSITWQRGEPRVVGEGDEGAGGVKGGGRRSASGLQSCQWPVTRSLSALLGGTH